MSWKILSLFLLVLLTSADMVNTRNKDRTIVESTHFYSEDQREAKLSISNVQKEKPLILILKKKNQNKYDIATNHVSVTLSTQNQTASCEFKGYHDLCVIPQVQDVKINMSISCEKTPCDVSWIIYQLEFNNIDQNQLAYGLFTLQQSSDHLVTTITCNDPQIKNFGEDINVYSESQYERGGTSKQAYFLFNNEEKGYIFIDIKQQSKKCAHLSILNIPKKINYSQSTVRDFTSKDSPSVIKLNMPKSDFRMDGQLNRFNFVKDHKFLTALSLFGLTKEGQQVLLSKHLIRPTHSDTQILFSVTFKRPKDQYEELLLRIQNNNLEMTVITFVINQYEVQEVQLGQRNYFDLKAGERIKYKLIQEIDADAEDKVYFIVQSNSNITLTSQQCPTKEGCEFELEALSDVSSHMYLSSLPKTEDQPEQIQFLPITKTIKKKIRDNVNMYFKKQVKSGKAFEVTVNNPNVLIYASSQQKCPIPSEQCSERTGNYHNPFVYTPKKDGLFLFNVEGLDSGEFIITIIDEDDQFIPLEDGVAFSYTMDQTEDKISFKYKLSERKDVTFNLIAPLNNVLLKVANDKEFTEGSDVEVSSDGFLVFSQGEIGELYFAIDVQKTSLSQNKFTHFTIIVSTGDVAIRLENTVTHYQTLPMYAYKEYVFEYDPSEEYIINFYSHNLKVSNTSVSIMLSFSNDRVWDSNNLDKVWIDKESDYLDLKYVSKQLCKKKGADSCQVFMRLQNQMQIVVDMAITLMVRNSIIQLKDGIWQSYSQNTIAASANFYFYPKHYNKDMTIIYSNTHSNLKLLYNLWKTDLKSINPVEWPFPQKPENDENVFRPINHVFIEKQILEAKCQPNCVVLITLYRNEDSNAFVNQQGYFRILASNNQIQLPESTRINFSLKKDEEKQVLVDLKYVLNANFMTLYSSHVLGSYNILANVYSQKNPRCPAKGESPDFQLLNGETDIAIVQIKAKISELQMQDDNNLYMCLAIEPFQNSKLSLQYTTSADVESGYKKIHLNSFEDIELQKGDKKIYQIDGNFDFAAKLIRKRGYPYVFIQQCKLSQLKDCKTQILNIQEKGKQLVGKTQEFEELPCQECIYFFKFQADEPAAVSFHLQSPNSQIELKQNQIMTDFISHSQESRYVITGIIGLDLMVNIHVQEGDLEARMTDGSDFSLVKQSTPQNKLIHFYISGEHSKNQNSQQNIKSNKFVMNPYRFSKTFNNFHLILTKKENKTCSYSVTYSSGKNKVFLQDGLITDITLQPQKLASFFYGNQLSSQHIYLTISMLSATQFSNVGIRCYYLEEGNESNRTQVPLIRPQIRKKTPKPTLLFSLPPKNYFEIQIINLSPKDKALSIGINHQQVILLPFSHEYPFIMHAKQQLNFLVEVSEPGYILATIRKCDESDPTFSYAYHYDSFIKNQFYAKIALNDDPTFQYFIKIQTIGTFYINFKSSPTENSLLSILLEFYQQKPERETVKPGHKGIIDYQIVDTKRAQISFAPIVCSSTKCPKVTYYTMNAKNKQDLYSQLVCPSNYFSSLQLTTAAPINLNKISYEEGSTSIKYTYDLVDHISFVGVKAINEKGEETYYRPVQIITFWGQLSRTNQNHLITIVVITLILIGSLLLYVRHSARKGYRPIEQNSSAPPPQSAESTESVLPQTQNDV